MTAINHKKHIFAILYTVVVAQLVRASDCGSEGRGFEPHLPPGNFKLAGNHQQLTLFTWVL
jgi:hypothetical protein